MVVLNKDCSRREFIKKCIYTGMGLCISTSVLASSVESLAKSRLSHHKARYYRNLKGKDVLCELCPNFCYLRDGDTGLCADRKNINGTLFSLVYAYPCAVHVDPIEKKPFFHFLPSTTAFSIATAGCNLRCSFCQNWQISQSTPEETRNYYLPPQRVVEEAKRMKCPSITFTYTEPTVFYEYMLDTAKLAKAAGLKATIHSCGYTNSEPLKELCQYLDAANIDLKSYREDFYRRLTSGALHPVLNSIKSYHKYGVHLEITNLVIPTQNDNPEDIKAMVNWIKKELGVDVPLHFTRFYPQFKMRNLPPTPVTTLEKARKIALDAGLKFVYIGNVPGHPGEDTYCPQCEKLLIKRWGFEVLENNIKKGRCKYCGEMIPGVF